LQAAKIRLEAEGKKLGNPFGARALRKADKGNTAAVATICAAADKHANDLKPVIESLKAEGEAWPP
jgi:hypothetical protein